MVYTFQLWKHPNIHYRDAVVRLSRCELFSMLKSLSIDTEIIQENYGTADFLTFECRELSASELSYLSGHSCFSFFAEKKGDLLSPVSVPSGDVFPDSLPEILKYKGKTNPSFTRMMLNTALSLTPYSRHPDQVTVLDPLCGRCTTLFCALCAGASAVGIDTDRKDLHEALEYFLRYLKLSGIKHKAAAFSETVASAGIPGTRCTFAGSKEDYQSGKTSSMTLYLADTGLAGPLMRKRKAHLLVTDLPYGVQHAPQDGNRKESFSAFLKRVIPSWKDALMSGGALAVSFNSLTVKAVTVRGILSDAGLHVLDSSDYSGLSHSVEQAVIRDLVFATIPDHSLV